MDFTTLRSGQKYTAAAIDNYGLAKSPVIVGGIYIFSPRIDLSSQADGVFNLEYHIADV